MWPDYPDSHHHWRSTLHAWRRRASGFFTDGGPAVWSIFPKSTKYFDPSRAPFMMNFRVDDLDALLDQLK